MLIWYNYAKWTEFCSCLFKGKQISQVKTDVIFQILYYILNGGNELTPFHVMLAKGIHSLTRSKELITALNHHGLCVSYNTVKRIDVDIAEHIIHMVGDNRVPLPPVLEATSPLNGAMDNFSTGTKVPLQAQAPLMTSSLLFSKMSQLDKKGHQTKVRYRQDPFPLRAAPQLSW